MNAIEKIFVKGRNYSRQFDVQKNLSESHRKINQPVYDKAIKEFEDTITDFIKKKLGDMVRKQAVLSIATYMKGQTPLNGKHVKPKDEKPEPKQPKLTDNIEG